MKEAKKEFAERYRELWKERESQLEKTPWYKWDKRRHLKKAIRYYKTMTEKFE